MDNPFTQPRSYFGMAIGIIVGAARFTFFCGKCLHIECSEAILNSFTCTTTPLIVFIGAGIGFIAGWMMPCMIRRVMNK